MKSIPRYLHFMMYALLVLLICFAARATKCAGAKVPYLQGNVDKTGLPENISSRKPDGRVKKPSDYGPKQIQAIMKVKDGINFVLRQQTADNSSVNINVPPFLLKLVTETRVKAMYSGQKISEDEFTTGGTRGDIE